VQDFFRKYLGLIGALLLIVSEFLPWFYSGSILIFEYVNRVLSVTIQDAFLYLFPIISGGICFSAKAISIYDIKYQMKSIAINIVGLSFLLVFLIEFIPSYLPSLFISIGIYVCIAGLCLIIIDLIRELSKS